MNRATARVPRQRLSAADLMRQLCDDGYRLAARMDAPARSHHESEDRVAEGERIATTFRKLVRG